MSENQGKQSENQRKPDAYPQTGVANTCRSYREYMDMFRLEPGHLGDGPVLDVAGGASSFSAQLNAMGIMAVAADPFYAGSQEQVLAAAREEIAVSSAKLAAAASAFDWSYYGSPEKHRNMREASFDKFAADFVKEDARTRYVAASLPVLPFDNGTFTVALCSHFLFLYADSFGEPFHREALAELLRVVRPGGEVRVYPLVSLKWDTCPFLPGLLADLKGAAEHSMLETALPFTPAQSQVLRLVKKG